MHLISHDTFTHVNRKLMVGYKEPRVTSRSVKTPTRGWTGSITGQIETKDAY